MDRAPTEQTTTPPSSSSRASRRWSWIERWIERRSGHLERVLLLLPLLIGVCLGLGFVCSWERARDQLSDAENEARPAELSMVTRRTPGERAKESRCADCTQPGDHILVSLVGSPAFVYGVRVYRDHDELAASCDACASLGFVVSALGYYEIVGLRVAPGCPLAAGAGIDLDLAAMARCGARLATARLEVR